MPSKLIAVDLLFRNAYLPISLIPEGTIKVVKPVFSNIPSGIRIPSILLRNSFNFLLPAKALSAVVNFSGILTLFKVLIFPKANSPNVSTVSGKVKNVRLVPSKA